MDEKEIYLNGEADQWFRRNRDAILEKKHSDAAEIIGDYLKKNKICKSQTRILEIGCSFGYNLDYYNQILGVNVYGIEPSQEAVDEGVSRYGKRLHLIRGTSDVLPYEDDFFDVVILGFCMFWVDRKYLFRSISEADRVLKCGGRLIVVDFDTIVPFKRNNIHNPNTYTYKMNYTNLFLANPQYFLVEKKSFSHMGDVFHADVQERISLNILYKDEVDNVYIRD